MAQVESRKLELQQVVPDFVLPSVDGKEASPRDYKQKVNLVLVYLDLGRCGNCVDYLREFADNYSVYRGLETQILAIVPLPISELQSRVGQIGLPFPVLSDEQGLVGKVYLVDSPVANPVGAVFVADRFGALRAMMFGLTQGDLPNQQSILDWLSLIETECPECGPGAESFQRE